MEKNGRAFARLYWYNDQPTTICLSELNVDEDCRRKGLGTRLQEIREEIALELGATTVMLWVDKNSWMHDWYIRRGYKDDQDKEDEENCIWMKKELKRDNDK